MGGGSQPTSETVIKGGKPFITREWLSRPLMEAQSKLAVEYGNRANLAEAQRRETMNQTLAMYGKTPYYQPYQTATGETINPNIAPTPVDPSGLIDPSMWKVPRTVGENKKEEPKTEREKYAKALDSTTGRDSSN
jgi:hypothetical protein